MYPKGGFSATLYKNQGSSPNPNHRSKPRPSKGSCEFPEAPESARSWPNASGQAASGLANQERAGEEGCVARPHSALAVSLPFPQFGRLFCSSWTCRFALKIVDWTIWQPKFSKRTRIKPVIVFLSLRQRDMASRSCQLNQLPLPMACPFLLAS